MQHHKHFLGLHRRDLHVAGLQIVETIYSPGSLCDPHAHFDPYFCFVLEGGLLDVSGPEREPVAAGEGFFRPPGARHAVAYGDRGALCLMVRLGAAWMGALDRKGRQGLPGDSGRRLVGALFGEDRERSVEDFVGSLVDCLDVVREPPDPRPEEHARLLLDRQSLRSRPKIANVAKRVGVHPSHLAREFRRRYGRTMGEYALELRVERARRQLARDVEPAQAAIEAGFHDQSHLTRAFRRFLRTTPARYRRRARSVQDPSRDSA